VGPITKLPATWLSSLAVVLSIGLLSPQAWALFSDDQARRAIIDLRTRVETLTTRVGDLERALQNSAQSQIQLLNENERMRAEVARLRGQLEEAALATSSGTSRQKDLYLDIDKRLEEQRTTLGALEEKLKQLEPVTVQASGGEKIRFEALLAALGAQDFKAVVRLADEFENDYANSALAADVLFMKGTALYADKALRAAIAARRDLISRFPRHPTIPQAMLNLAAAQTETGNPTAARRTLEELIKAHPKSAAAAEARKRLK
jgi:TolA-binding protein